MGVFTSDGLFWEKSGCLSGSKGRFSKPIPGNGRYFLKWASFSQKMKLAEINAKWVSRYGICIFQWVCSRVQLFQTMIDSCGCLLQGCFVVSKSIEKNWVKQCEESFLAKVMLYTRVSIFFYVAYWKALFIGGFAKKDTARLRPTAVDRMAVRFWNSSIWLQWHGQNGPLYFRQGISGTKDGL